jgi:mannonate dehydratase
MQEKKGKPMKLGLGLYRSLFTQENFRFAKQAGATHIVAHMVGYQSDQVDPMWCYEEMLNLRKAINAEGLELAAIENFDPILWYDVLLDGPRKKEQMEHLKQIIRDIGRAGIPVFGYDFSVAGVWGHSRGPWARGGAESVAFLDPEQPPMPKGMIWSHVVDHNAPAGEFVTTTPEEHWARYQYFLDEIIPVAEEAGVRMAAHPDDPPMPTLRGTARHVYQPHLYQKVLDMHPSYYNACEFCLGTIAEMTEDDPYWAIDKYSKQGNIAYIHFRNVKGHVPHYYEVFIDEGDVDMIRILRILKRNNYEGVLIPDHTPAMSCAAPWHAGMAFALGYIKAAMTMINQE